jgi:hypothetical protein
MVWFIIMDMVLVWVMVTLHDTSSLFEWKFIIIIIICISSAANSSYGWQILTHVRLSTIWYSFFFGTKEDKLQYIKQLQIQPCKHGKKRPRPWLGALRGYPIPVSGLWHAQVTSRLLRKQSMADWPQWSSNLQQHLVLQSGVLGQYNQAFSPCSSTIIDQSLPNHGGNQAITPLFMLEYQEVHQISLVKNCPKQGPKIHQQRTNIPHCFVDSLWKLWPRKRWFRGCWPHLQLLDGSREIQTKCK